LVTVGPGTPPLEDDDSPELELLDSPELELVLVPLAPEEEELPDDDALFEGGGGSLEQASDTKPTDTRASEAKERCMPGRV